jgi:hypothetical protein
MHKTADITQEGSGFGCGTLYAFARVMTALFCRSDRRENKTTDTGALDQMLISRRLQGDAAAWEAIVRSYAGRI